MSMETLGSYLKRERELQQLSVAEIAQTTRIPARILLQIEKDDFTALPAEVFVRGYLSAYARSLDIDEQLVLERFKQIHVALQPEAVPLPNVSAPESGRSFGIAIALVILLILFTLALSIVLRPRHRATPVELSWLSQPYQPKPLYCAQSITESRTASLRS
jgi:cytoskeletal protein RodZ